jgi:hypothetical protein
MHLSATHRDKLDPKARKCIFLGYSITQKGYYDTLLKLYMSRDVKFLEDTIFFYRKSRGDLV